MSVFVVVVVVVLVYNNIILLLLLLSYQGWESNHLTVINIVFVVDVAVVVVEGGNHRVANL